MVLSNLNAPQLTSQLKAAMLSFANFHRLNESSMNSIQACRTSLRSFGKLLGELSYFDYEGVSPAQE